MGQDTFEPEDEDVDLPVLTPEIMMKMFANMEANR
jgi:hypothetical protein